MHIGLVFFCATLVEESEIPTTAGGHRCDDFVVLLAHLCDIG